MQSSATNSNDDCNNNCNFYFTNNLTKYQTSYISSNNSYKLRITSQAQTFEIQVTVKVSEIQVRHKLLKYKSRSKFPKYKSGTNF